MKQTRCSTYSDDTGTGGSIAYVERPKNRLVDDENRESIGVARQLWAGKSLLQRVRVGCHNLLICLCLFSSVYDATWTVLCQGVLRIQGRRRKCKEHAADG